MGGGEGEKRVGDEFQVCVFQIFFEIRNFGGGGVIWGRRKLGVYFGFVEFEAFLRYFGGDVVEVDVFMSLILEENWRILCVSYWYIDY